MMRALLDVVWLSLCIIMQGAETCYEHAVVNLVWGVNRPEDLSKLYGFKFIIIRIHKK
jgi:hypothetical protein